MPSPQDQASADNQARQEEQWIDQAEKLRIAKEALLSARSHVHFHALRDRVWPDANTHPVVQQIDQALALL